MLKKIFCLIIWFSYLSQLSFGQSENFKSLTIGDTVPNLILKGFLDDSLIQKPLTSYLKGKLLLIDLSATWCVPCVEAWPKLDSLKTIYNGDLKILAVTQEKRETVKAFFKHNPALNLNLDFITDNVRNNPSLFRAFLVKMVPQVIWLSPKGIVIAITDGDKVTMTNIAQAMETGKLNLRIKKDVMNFSPLDYNISDSNAVYKSLLTGPQWGLPASAAYTPLQNIDEVKAVHRILLTNNDIRALYWHAAYYHSVNMENDEWIIWESDSLRMKHQYTYYEKRVSNPLNYDTWGASTVYCYQLEIQGVAPFSDLRRRMINDFNFALHLYGRFEDRLVPCWILKKRGAVNAILSNGSTPEVIYEAGIAKMLRNQDMKRVTYFLNKYLIRGRITDETGIKQNVDIDLTGLKGDLTTPEDLTLLLKKYNLALEKGQRKLPVFVISKL